jgi:hypothetical protein
MSTETFQQALTRLVSDESYRKTIEGSPRQLLSDFALDPGEIGVLMQVWEKTRESDVLGHSIDISVSCCCCCCC